MSVKKREQINNSQISGRYHSPGEMDSSRGSRKTTKIGSDTKLLQSPEKSEYLNSLVRLTPGLVMDHFGLNFFEVIYWQLNEIFWNYISRNN